MPRPALTGATHRSKSTRAARRPSARTSEDENKLYEVLDRFGKALALVQIEISAYRANGAAAYVHHHLPEERAEVVKVNLMFSFFCK